MGLNQGGGNITYLKISDGKIAQRVQEGTDGAIRCTNKDGNRVWYELRYNSVNGRITNVTTRDHEYGRDLCISLVDGRDNFQLQMPLDSKYAKGFLFSMPSIDVTRNIYFTPWMKKVDEKKKTALYLSYGYGEENKIPWYWTKDNPGQLPPMVQIKVKGKETWDDTDQMDFLLAYLAGDFLTKIKEVAPSQAFRSPVDNHSEDMSGMEHSESEQNGEQSDDDLPF